jgi:glycosyltransferase involved in cell wall biosynthesis
MQASLDVFLPLPLTRRGPSYTCGMLSQGMAGPELNVSILTPRTRSYPVYPAAVVQSLPLWARYVPFRWVKSVALEGFDERYLLEVRRCAGPFRGAYIWPDAKLQTIHELKRDGIVVFREMINCHRGTAKTILDDAYARIGVEPQHTITEASASGEQELLDAVDYIFCPNEMVEKSLIQHGLSRAKLLPASYGWEPSRFAGTHRLLEPLEGITLVFVGSICVRKGCHLLLDYWARSGVQGRLVLAGEVEPTIHERFGDLIARNDVVVLDFVTDIGALYHSADVFVFPSLEEGGPQVTYEACGCALPVITTPMGAGRIVRHGKEGYVLDPFDREGWIAAIRALAGDRERRAVMGAAARLRADLFRWELVAMQRKEQILKRLLGLHTAQEANLPQIDVALTRAAQ